MGLGCSSVGAVALVCEHHSERHLNYIMGCPTPALQNAMAGMRRQAGLPEQEALAEGGTAAVVVEAGAAVTAG